MSSTSKRASCIDLSKDLETEGFDLQAGQTWIYPTNYPMRDYQYNIIQQALLKNTLVSLPTGLGKTFIAAVVMYNFYRWYPHGKVIFMAPTRPLVKQQIDACYDIMGIPKEVTAEITGSKVSSASRGNIWKEKRVFFITPHVLQNDLETLDDLAQQIKCVVFDEAHKARGNYAYCEVIKKLERKNKYYRVLALSATPGSNLNDVVEVANSLLISRLEFRTEESPDVVEYVFNRNIETVVVPLNSKLIEVKEKYLQILEFYTKVLVKHKIINGNYGNISKGRIFLVMKDFQQKQRGTGNAHYGEIMKSLNICVTLYHAFELLIRHGLRSFLSFYEEHIDKPLLRGNAGIIALMNDIREYLGPAPNIEQLPDGSYPELSPLTKFGHPKYYKLKEILSEHFNKSTNSRVIVFFEYRESVMEAYAMLQQAKPLVKPRIFLGQGYGVTQRVQINVIKAFREGSCNTLLSTCIGEEGLDVGEVDLILCFDISNASPIRMIQRMGRTGRKQEGNIFFLVTEGKEQDTLRNCLIQKQNLQHYVLASKELNNSLKKDSPRLVPEGVVPRCEKMFITVKKTVLTKNSSIKDMLKSISSGSGTPVFSQELEMKDFEEKIPKSITLWNKENPMQVDVKPKNIFSKHIEKQRTLQPTHRMSHSKSSKFFAELFQFADSKRYNIPMTQMNSMSATQSESKNMKQGDIRNMFFKPTIKNTQEDPVLAQVSALSQATVLENAIVDIISKEVFDEISSYLLIESSANKTCKYCPENFDCTKFTMPSKDINLNSWVQPDLSVFDKITDNDLDSFLDSLSPKPKNNVDELNYAEVVETPMDLEDFGDQDVGESFFDVDTSIVETKTVKAVGSFLFKPPKTLGNILNKYRKSIISQSDLVEPVVENTSIVKSPKQVEEKMNISEESLDGFKEENVCNKIKIVSPKNEDDNINLSVEFLEDFNEPSFHNDFNKNNTIKNYGAQSTQHTSFQNGRIDFSEASFHQNNTNTNNFTETSHHFEQDDQKIDQQEILSFFKLTELKELYDLENDSFNDTQNTIIYTPESSPLKVIPTTPENEIFECLSPVISYSQRTNRSNSNLSQISSSPMLSFNKKKVLSLKKKKINFSALFKDGDLEGSPKCKSNLFTPSKFDENTSKVCSTPMVKKNDVEDMDIDDFCDLSEFNISKSTVSNSEKLLNEISPVISKPEKVTTFNDFCDLADFNNSTNQNTTIKENSPKLDSTIKSTTNEEKLDAIFNISTNKNTTVKPKSPKLDSTIKSTIAEGNKLDIDDFCDLSDFDISINNLKQIESQSIQSKRNISEKSTNLNTTVVSNISDFNVTKRIKSRRNTNSSETEDIFESLNEVDDICDLSEFGIATPKTATEENKGLNDGLDDFFDLSDFELSEKPSTSKKESPESSPVLSFATQRKNTESQLTQTKRNLSSKLQLTITQKPPNTQTQRKNPTQSQLGITQMLSLISKDQKQEQSTSQKENARPQTNISIMDDLANFEEFNFSFNTKKPTPSRSKLSTLKNTQKTQPTQKKKSPFKPILEKSIDHSHDSTLNSTFDNNLNNSSCNDTITISDSDDEFEPKTIKPKETKLFKKPTISPARKKVAEQKPKGKNKKKKSSGFLLTQAELSDDENVYVSDDEHDDDDEDSYDNSFVDTGEVIHNTQMHANYLQSIRSPVRPGQFKIPQRPKHNVSNVFSQFVDMEDDTYLHDSFVVNTEDVDAPAEHDLSELEILELKLKEQRRNKKRKSSEDKKGPQKRRRIIQISDDSD